MRQAAQQSRTDRSTETPRFDGFVSLGCRSRVSIAFPSVSPVADPIIGLLITLVIAQDHWDSWQTIYGAPAEIGFSGDRVGILRAGLVVDTRTRI